MKKVFYLLCLFALNAEAQISELWNQAHNELKKIKSTEPHVDERSCSFFIG